MTRAEVRGALVDHEGCPYSAALASESGWFCNKCGRAGRVPRTTMSNRERIKFLIFGLLMALLFAGCATAFLVKS